MFFLITYDRCNSKLEEIKTFPNEKIGDAANQRLKLELNNLKRGIEREVVILDARRLARGPSKSSGEPRAGYIQQIQPDFALIT